MTRRGTQFGLVVAADEAGRAESVLKVRGDHVARKLMVLSARYEGRAMRALRWLARHVLRWHTVAAPCATGLVVSQDGSELFRCHPEAAPDFHARSWRLPDGCEVRVAVDFALPGRAWVTVLADEVDLTPRRPVAGSGPMPTAAEMRAAQARLAAEARAASESRLVALSCHDARCSRYKKHRCHDLDCRDWRCGKAARP